MEAKENPFSTSMERLNGLMAWWGMPGPNGNGAVGRQIKRLQQFAADFQKTCADAYSGEMSAVLNSNERLGRSVQEFVRCRQPSEVLAAESEILVTLLEGASLQAKLWAELTQRLQECCAAVARDAAADLRQQAEASAPAKGDPESAPQPAKTAPRPAAPA
jgi:hypothetical protein